MEIHLVAEFSTHAEILSVFLITRYIVYARIIAKFARQEQLEPSTIYVDNKSAVEICKTMKIMEKTGSINMQINVICQHLNQREIKLVFV